MSTRTFTTVGFSYYHDTSIMNASVKLIDDPRCNQLFSQCIVYVGFEQMHISLTFQPTGLSNAQVEMLGLLQQDLHDQKKILPTTDIDLVRQHLHFS